MGFCRFEGDGQTVWKSGGIGSGGGFDAFDVGLSTPVGPRSVKRIIKPFGFGPLLERVAFPTIPTTKTSVQRSETRKRCGKSNA
jgi:hypothetical protein